MGFYQQEHPRAGQGRQHHGQERVPDGHHEGGLGHVCQGLRVRHPELCAQGPAVHDTTGLIQTTKVVVFNPSPALDQLQLTRLVFVLFSDYTGCTG